MEDKDFVRVPAAKAHEICAKVELEEPARQLLRQEDSPKAYLERLRARELHADAVRFLAAGLPKREAVWWSCVSLRQLAGGKLPSPDEEAVVTAEAWVYKPAQPACEAAGALAEEAGYGTPAALAAAAAHWAGDTLAPADQPKVQPAESLTPGAVANALILAASQAPEGDPAAAFEQILERGAQIAQGITSKKALSS